MHITDQEVNKQHFQFCRKVALLKVRPLTEADFKQRDGLIQTQEGPIHFEPDDYLIQGIEDEEWPISKEHFTTNYEQVGEPDLQGFVLFRSTTICQACQIPEAFTVQRRSGDIFSGKAGDYLVRAGSKMWIVDRTIFGKSYELLLEH